MPTLNLRHLLQRGSFFLLPASSGWYNQLKSPEFISCAIHYLSRVLLNSFMVSLLNFTLTKTSNTTFPCLDKSIFIRGKTSAQFFKFFPHNSHMEECFCKQKLCTFFNYYTLCLHEIPLGYPVAFHLTKTCQQIVATLK